MASSCRNMDPAARQARLTNTLLVLVALLLTINTTVQLSGLAGPQRAVAQAFQPRNEQPVVFNSAEFDRKTAENTSAMFEKLLKIENKLGQALPVRVIEMPPVRILESDKSAAAGQ